MGRLELKGAMDWLRKDNCMHGVMESTGVYWVPVYTVFKEAGFMYLANAYQVKSIPGRKSDQKDAEWLAYLLRAELIKPCYIPDERYEELRALTRLRTKLVQTQTSFKNRVHKTPAMQRTPRVEDLESLRAEQDDDTERRDERGRRGRGDRRLRSQDKGEEGRHQEIDHGDAQRDRRTSSS